MSKRYIWVLAASMALSACASSSGQQAKALEQAQYAWSAAIRWGDLEGALAQTPPENRRVLSDVERNRWQQIQVSSYRVVSHEPGSAAQESVRQVEIGLVNRNTMTERNTRYREVWRWDDERKTWWNTAGLPDLWGGQ